MDRQAVEELAADVDVVIHLAFIIFGSREESARVNLAGARNVFEATVAAERPRRLVYTSSVAAYGYYSDNPVPLIEDVPPRGSPEHSYSEQKAACEAELAEITKGSSLECLSFARASSRGRKRPRWPTRYHIGIRRPPTGRTLNVGEQKDNIGVPFAPYLYTVSTMHCMKRVAGVGRRRAGHGMGQRAGHVREIESDPINYYYVARK